MTDDNDSRQPELVILSTPQISVTLNQYDEIEIDTSFIGSDFQHVEHGSVVIPMAQVKEVAEAMLAILRKRGG